MSTVNNNETIMNKNEITRSRFGTRPRSIYTGNPPTTVSSFPTPPSSSSLDTPPNRASFSHQSFRRFLWILRNRVSSFSFTRSVSKNVFCEQSYHNQSRIGIHAMVALIAFLTVSYQTKRCYEYGTTKGGWSPLQQQQQNRPREYNAGDVLPLATNRLTSTRTQIPGEYYELPVCHPYPTPSQKSKQQQQQQQQNNSKKKKKKAPPLPKRYPEPGPQKRDRPRYPPPPSNLYPPLPHEIRVLEDRYCSVLCQTPPFTSQEVELMRDRIRRGYRANWLLDDLPSANVGIPTEEAEAVYGKGTMGGVSEGRAVTVATATHYAEGFPLGFIEEAPLHSQPKSPFSNSNSNTTSSSSPQAFVYNHVTISIEYYQPILTKPSYRILTFSIEPLSISHRFIGGFEWDGRSTQTISDKYLSTCVGGVHIARGDVQENQKLGVGEVALWTYDVVWKDVSGEEDELAVKEGEGEEGWRRFVGGWRRWLEERGKRTSVKRKKGDQWSRRWEIYVRGDERVKTLRNVRWYSVSNCLIVVTFLTVCVVGALYRSLRNEFVWNNHGEGFVRRKFVSEGEGFLLGSVVEEGQVGDDTVSSYGGFRSSDRRFFHGSSIDGKNDNNKKEDNNDDYDNHIPPSTPTYRWHPLFDDDDDDIFRPPSTCPSLYCALVGTGIQLAASAVAVLLVGATTGIFPLLDPSSRPPHLISPPFLGSGIGGPFIIPLGASFTFLGGLGGYVSGWLYQIFQGRRIRLCAVQTAMFWPMLCFVTHFCLEMVVVRGRGGSGVHESIIFAKDPYSLRRAIVTFGRWGMIYLPFSFYGFYSGYYSSFFRRSEVCGLSSPLSNTTTVSTAVSPTPSTLPTTVGPLFPQPSPRRMPPSSPSTISSSLYDPLVVIVASGLIPFSASYVEIFFGMTSAWLGRYWYIGGLTTIVCLTVVIACAEISVLATYHRLLIFGHRRLRHDDYSENSWWWFAMGCGGSVGGYLLGYSAVWFRALKTGGVDGGDAGDDEVLWCTYLLYFVYMLLVSTGFALVTGSVGVLSTFFFLRKVRSIVKVD